MNDDMIAFDRLSSQLYSIDLADLRRCPSKGEKPANRRRQKIVRFRGKDGPYEIFSVLQTVPYRGHEQDAPPTGAQQAAVNHFFNVECETRYQASTMLSARNYAEVAARRFSYDASRRMIIWIGAAAYILADKDMRSLVRSRDIGLRGHSTETGILNHRPFRKVMTFCDKLISDLRGEGAEVFG